MRVEQLPHRMLDILVSRAAVVTNEPKLRKSSQRYTGKPHLATIA
jgi:hypothetical protein